MECIQKDEDAIIGENNGLTLLVPSFLNKILTTMQEMKDDMQE